MTSLARLDLEPPADWIGDRRRLTDRCRDLIVACERAELVGVDVVEAERELDEAGVALAALDDLIFAMPAENFADLAFKAQLIRQLPVECRQTDELDLLLQMLLRDIERVAR